MCEKVSQFKDGILNFSGETYDAEFDQSRLIHQWKRVFDLMHDGEWRSLREISMKTGDPESSVSARLRDLRNKYGYVVNRRRRAGLESKGVWEYRVVSFEFDEHGQCKFL